MDHIDSERRTAPRATYSAIALVYVGKERFTCRAIDVSALGMLLIPPTRIAVDAQIEVNLTFPGLDQIIDVGGTVTRETTVDGYPAFGVRFDSPSAATCALLDTFVQWAAKHAGVASEPKPPATDKQRSGVAALERRMTGPAFSLASLSSLAEADDAVDPKSTLAADPSTDEMVDPTHALRDEFRETIRRVETGEITSKTRKDTD